MNQISMGAVIVTYNRLDKLKITLDCFEQNTRHPKYLLLIDNASTDGTVEFLQQWEKEESDYQRIVVYNDTNLGGSGGFYTALQKASTLDADWIWISDDDAWPRKDALEHAYAFLEGRKDIDEISAICGTVYNNGTIDLSHRKNMYPKKDRVQEVFCSEKLYQEPYFPLNCFSYVGTVINKSKLLEVGFTKKEYFIWWDDTEHSLRLAKAGKIYCVPSIGIDHNVAYAPEGEVSWKSYYGYRNMADMYRLHFPKICYTSYVARMRLRVIRNRIKKVNMAENDVIWDALRDCAKHQFGISPVYKPGWKPSK